MKDNNLLIDPSGNITTNKYRLQSDDSLANKTDTLLIDVNGNITTNKYRLQSDDSLANITNTLTIDPSGNINKDNISIDFNGIIDIENGKYKYKSNSESKSIQVYKTGNIKLDNEDNKLYIYNATGQLVKNDNSIIINNDNSLILGGDSNLISRVILRKSASDAFFNVNSATPVDNGPLHIAGIKFYDISNNQIPISNITFKSIGLDSSATDTYMNSLNNINDNHTGHGLFDGLNENAYIFTFTQPVNLKSIDITNRKNCCKGRILNTNIELWKIININSNDTYYLKSSQKITPINFGININDSSKNSLFITTNANTETLTNKFIVQ